MGSMRSRDLGVETVVMGRVGAVAVVAAMDIVDAVVTEVTTVGVVEGMHAAEQEDVDQTNPKPQPSTTLLHSLRCL
jgi:hypothetical protein